MKAVGAIIQNQQGEFLMQFRDENPKYYPLTWSLFGGGVEDGESPDQAIIRELKEEIDFAITNPELIDHNIESGTVEQFIYLIKTNKKITEFILREGKEMRYISKDDLFDRVFAFNIESVLKRFIEKLEYN